MSGTVAAMTEPDVTLTDYGLTIECAVFALLLYSYGDRSAPLRPWFALFFASIGAAALGGGTVHGFFSDTETLGYRILWPSTLMAIGLTAMTAWIIGAKLWLSEKLARYISILAALEFAVYSALVLFLTQSFFLVVINYVPATIFLLSVFYILYSHMRIRELRAGVLGLLLTFVAAAVQIAGITFDLVYLNHNALYHLIQAAALFMIFQAARWLIQRR